MFGGDGQSVEENQEDDQPIEKLRFDRRPALPPAQPVPPARVPTAGREGRKERKKGVMERDGERCQRGGERMRGNGWMEEEGGRKGK